MNSADTKQMALWIATGFIAGILVTLLAVRLGWVAAPDTVPDNETEQVDNGETEDTTDEDETGTTTSDVEIGVPTGETVTSETAAVSAQDQSAGDTAVASAVTLENEGWIVVHEMIAGQVGNALGATRRPAGEHADVTVRLLRATEPGGEYGVMLYEDDGDGAFDLRSDFPVLNENMNPVISLFETHENDNATEEETTQDETAE